MSRINMFRFMIQFLKVLIVWVIEISSIRIRKYLQEKTTKKLWRNMMRDNKMMHKDSEKINKVQSDELLEISQTGYGLESVTKGADYVEGDKDNSPNGGGL